MRPIEPSSNAATFLALECQEIRTSQTLLRWLEEFVIEVSPFGVFLTNHRVFACTTSSLQVLFARSSLRHIWKPLKAHEPFYLTSV